MEELNELLNKAYIPEALEKVIEDKADERFKYLRETKLLKRGFRLGYIQRIIDELK